jgi:hypothetical protein
VACAIPKVSCSHFMENNIPDLNKAMNDNAIEMEKPMMISVDKDKPFMMSLSFSFHQNKVCSGEFSFPLFLSRVTEL